MDAVTPPAARSDIPHCPFTVVLGIAQDAGFPAAGCHGPCCARAWQKPELRRFAACLGVVDPQSRQRWIIDCTPDFRGQLHVLDVLCGAGEVNAAQWSLGGILLTHAHVGHYLGLAHLGREGLNASGIPVHAMPRMARFLRANQPWSQLVELGQIVLSPLADGEPIPLNQRISVTPVQVPHRGELSETAGFLVTGPDSSVFYLPDIDGWEHWREETRQMIRRADVLYLDGTFFSGDELPGRDMSEIPHPPISASMALFAELPAERRSRIRFIHFNHTNPVLNLASEEASRVRQAGFAIAQQGELAEL